MTSLSNPERRVRKRAAQTVRPADQQCSIQGDRCLPEGQFGEKALGVGRVES
jgi:hypothetical protein